MFMEEEEFEDEWFQEVVDAEAGLEGYRRDGSRIRESNCPSKGEGEGGRRGSRILVERVEGRRRVRD